MPAHVRKVYVLGCTESNVYHLQLDGVNGAVEFSTAYTANVGVNANDAGSTTGGVMGIHATDLVVLVSRANSNQVGAAAVVCGRQRGRHDCLRRWIICFTLRL